MKLAIELLEKEIKSLEKLISNYEECIMYTESTIRKNLMEIAIEDKLKLIKSYKDSIKILSNERKSVRKHECKEKKCNATKGSYPCTNNPIDDGCNDCKFYY